MVYERIEHGSSKSLESSVPNLFQPKKVSNYVLLIKLLKLSCIFNLIGKQRHLRLDFIATVTLRRAAQCPKVLQVVREIDI